MIFPQGISYLLAPETSEIDTGTVLLDGDLTLPVGARGVVVFAHGSGSSRRSPRNREVAAVLHEARLATLLFEIGRAHV